MAKKPTNPATRKDTCFKLSLTSENADKLRALATFEGKDAAVIVRELVEKYLNERATDIAQVQSLNADYQEKLALLRRSSTATS